MSRRARCGPISAELLAEFRADARRLSVEESKAERRPDGSHWYRIVDQAGDPTSATVHIYDEIGYWGVSADDFARDLGQITADTITVRINSPGGEVYDGLAIYNTLRNHSAEIIVHVDALAASAASFIAMAGDTIVIESTAEMMIHDASGLCWGPPADMRRMADTLDRMSDTIAGVYAERSGTDRAGWREAMLAETTYQGQAAVDIGLADVVATPPARKPKSTGASASARVDQARDLDPEWSALVKGLDEEDRDSTWTSLTRTLICDAEPSVNPDTREARV